MSKIQLLIATTNPGKTNEIKEFLRDEYLAVYNLSDFKHLSGIEVEETGTSLFENAEIKARTFGRLSGILTLSDDTGLFVEALDGNPGISSKRYGSSDQQRIDRLLDEMKHVPATKRNAYFMSSIVLFDPASEKTTEFVGRIDGQIALKPEGENGFGYDPVFYVPNLNKTFAMMKAEEKNQVSHRGQALQKLKKFIRKRVR